MNEKQPQHIALEIHVLAYDMHRKGTGYCLVELQPSPVIVLISNNNTDINKTHRIDSTVKIINITRQNFFLNYYINRLQDSLQKNMIT